MKPVIGISMQYDPELPRYSMSSRYAEAIAAAGGIPLLLPFLPEDCISDMLQLCDGVLFSGGADINPALYGQEKDALCGKLDDRRDEAELRLFRMVMEKELPILGICRGTQLLNVALGGSLIQHIPGHVGTTHAVSVEKDSLLYPVTGDRCRVNSGHHQVIDRPGQGLNVIARNEEGMIEAVELPGHPFFLAVQWHPEEMYIPDEDPVSREIFRLLIDAAKRNRSL